MSSKPYDGASYASLSHAGFAGRVCMIFRLSSKLATKIKVTAPKSLPLDANQLADWSGHLFTATRTQYVIVTNTASLYSAVMHGRGIVNDGQLLDRATSCLREVMADDGLEFLYLQFIAPASATVRFSKALNRSVMGSMNDLVSHAKMWLTEGDLPPHDTSFRLNEIPMSVLGYHNPREVMKGLTDASGPCLPDAENAQSSPR